MRTLVLTFLGAVLLIGASFGVPAGPAEARVHEADKMLLSEADTNQDGTITEDEYAKQVGRITAPKH